MSLKDQITEDMKNAMRAKDKARLSTLRLATAALKQIEVDERIELDDTRVLAILDKMVKQRKDSISQFSDAGRTDLVEVEEAELVVINNYMPEQLSDEDVAAAVDKAITDSGADSMKDMGKLMGMLKGQLDGKADMGLVSRLIKDKLS